MYIISLKDIRVNTGETQGHLSVVFTAEVLGKERKESVWWTRPAFPI